MLFYVIRQKSTGYLFPATGRGSSHAEFTPWGSPRLFTKRHFARVCLAYWLRGKTTVTRTGGGSWDDYDERWETVPVSGRVAGDYEVVEAELNLKLEVSA